MTKEQLEKAIELMEFQVDNLYYKETPNSDYEWEEYFSKRDKLWKQIDELKRKLLFLNGPTVTGKEIDLYKLGENASFEIYLHGTTTCIGTIEYRGRWGGYFGDIGYRIHEPFRGNHYALKALRLIREPILATGETEITITADPDNLASVKTIEAFGGKLIDSSEGVSSYSCNLMEEEEKRHVK